MQLVSITKEGLKRLVNLGERWDEGVSLPTDLRIIERIVLLSISARGYNQDGYLLFPANPWNIKTNIPKDIEAGYSLALWISEHSYCMPNEPVTGGKRALGNDFTLGRYKWWIGDLKDKGYWNITVNGNG